MSYMILDVVVFLFIFVIVYVAFTLSIVQVYNVYSSERTGHFNTHKSAFKLFFWAMIRTGNPQFADIRVFNATKSFDKECLSSTLTTVGLWYHGIHRNCTKIVNTRFNNLFDIHLMQKGLIKYARN